MRARQQETRYLGVYVVYDRGDWFVTDNKGGSQCYGACRPTEQQVTDYRDSIDV